MYICRSTPVKKFGCLVTGDHIRDQMIPEIETRRAKIRCIPWFFVAIALMPRCSIATSSLLPGTVPGIAQLGTLDTGKAGLVIQPLAGALPINFAEGTPLKADQITRQDV